MNMHPANILITGATDGIGLETASQLAALGHRITIVGRNPDKGHAAVRALRQAVANPRISFEQADLSSQQQIHDLARRAAIPTIGSTCSSTTSAGCSPTGGRPLTASKPRSR